MIFTVFFSDDGYDSLINYFRTNFALMHHHKYSLNDLENMLPWERFIYVDLIKQHIKEEEDRIREQKAMQKSQQRRR